MQIKEPELQAIRQMTKIRTGNATPEMIYLLDRIPGDPGTLLIVPLVGILGSPSDGTTRSFPETIEDTRKEKKEMKKNKMMRAASALLVLTLLSVCVISGTFAKYVTSAEGSDSARVAKFGVAITANGTTFANTYAKDDTATAIANTVVSTDKVVAPGTKGDMASMKLTGTPEVAVKVSYKGEFAIDDKWTVDGTFYCPLEIKVNDTTIKGTDYQTAEAFNKAVNDAITGYSKEYAPGTNLATLGDDSLKVTWAWAYEGNDDAKDTALGEAAAENNAANVTLKVTTTVTQID